MQIEVRGQSVGNAIVSRMEQLSQTIRSNAGEAERSLGQLAATTVEAIRNSAHDAERSITAASAGVSGAMKQDATLRRIAHNRTTIRDFYAANQEDTSRPGEFVLDAEPGTDHAFYGIAALARHQHRFGRFTPGAQQHGIEGFGQVVVGAHFQPDHTIGFVSPRAAVGKKGVLLLHGMTGAPGDQMVVDTADGPVAWTDRAAAAHFRQISEAYETLSDPDRRHRYDTVGYTVPEEYTNFMRTLIERVPNSDKARFSVHCHNDLGMAVANSLAAVRAALGGRADLRLGVSSTAKTVKSARSAAG